MSYIELLKKQVDNWEMFELTLVLVVLDKYPLLDKMLRENRPKSAIVNSVIDIRQAQMKVNKRTGEIVDAKDY